MAQSQCPGAPRTRRGVFTTDQRSSVGGEHAGERASRLVRIGAVGLDAPPVAPLLDDLGQLLVAQLLRRPGRDHQLVLLAPARPTVAAEDLAAGRLVDAGAGGFSIGVEIRLFRPLRRQSNTAEAFWKAMAKQSLAQRREP